MKSAFGRIFGLGSVLALLASPALAQPYYGYGGPYGYGAPYHRDDGWYAHEQREAAWRAHERHEAWWRASHGYGYGRSYGGYGRGGDDDWRP